MIPSLRRLNGRLFRPGNSPLNRRAAAIYITSVNLPIPFHRCFSNLDLPIDGIDRSRQLDGVCHPSKRQLLKLESPNDSEGPDNSDSPDCGHQQRMANLGSTIEDLKKLVPHLLHKSLPKYLLLSEIMLRMNPSHMDLLKLILPNIKGHVSYYAACKALQLFFTSVVVNPQAQFHIQLVRTSNFPEPNTVFAHSTKIYMRWNTCEEGCAHLHQEVAEMGNDDSDTSRTKLGSHNWNSLDAIDKEHSSWSLADLTNGIIGRKKDGSSLGRVILGVFIFELSPDNSQIIVHTIDDMVILERREDDVVEEKLRVC